MRAIPILAAITLIACSPATDNTVTRIELTPIPITHVDSEAIEILASLTDPTKLDSLTGKRAATPRLRKACYWLHTATDPAEAIEQAQKQNGSHGTLRAQETASALLRSINHIRKKQSINVLQMLQATLSNPRKIQEMLLGT